VDQEAAYGKEHGSSRTDLGPGVVMRLRVESKELVDVPRVADIVAFKCLEAIGAWFGHLRD
jgi:hypothetical protein